MPKGNLLAGSASEEWEPAKTGYSMADQSNAAAPPGARQAPFDMTVLNMLRSHQSFDQQAAPDLNQEFSRKLYEKGAIQNWKDQNEDMFLTPDESSKLFPTIPGLPVDQANYTLTPVSHDPWSA